MPQWSMSGKEIKALSSTLGFENSQSIGKRHDKIPNAKKFWDGKNQSFVNLAKILSE